MTEPDFAPRADGLEQAIRAGRRRRAQRQFGGAGAAAAVAAFALVMSLHPFAAGSPSDSLRVGIDPTASAGETPGGGEPSAEPTDKTNAPDPTRSATPTDTDHGGISQGGGPYSNPQDPANGEPTTEPTADAPDRVSPQPEHSTVALVANSDCQQNPVAVPGQATEWCLHYSGDTTAKRGGTATISADLCRMPGQGTGTWTFDDQDGMEFEVDGTSTEWTSQDGRKLDTKDWTATIEANTCLRFTTTWDTRDRDGFRVRPGTYDAYFAVSGQPTSGSWSSSQTAQLTITD